MSNLPTRHVGFTGMSLAHPASSRSWVPPLVIDDPHDKRSPRMRQHRLSMVMEAVAKGFRPFIYADGLTDGSVEIRRAR